MHKLLYASSHDGKEVQGSDMVAPISGGETAGIVCRQRRHGGAVLGGGRQRLLDQFRRLNSALAQVGNRFTVAV